MANQKVANQKVTNQKVANQKVANEKVANQKETLYEEKAATPQSTGRLSSLPSRFSAPGEGQQPCAVPGQLLSPWTLSLWPLVPVFCLGALFLYEDTGLWLGSSSTHHDLVLTDSIYKEPIFKWSGL